MDQNPPGSAEPTEADLRKRATELDIAGRSTMDKPALQAAIATAEAAAELAARVDPSPGAAAVPEVEDTSGRPPLAEQARDRAANRNPRVVGAPKED